MIKKVLLTVLALLVVGIAGVLVIAAGKPDINHVERTMDIKAPPDKIYALISDLRSWPKWSPYENKDPNMKRSFSGPASGVGAVYEWDGNDEVGKGRMEVIEAVAPSKIKTRLHFIKPFEGDDIAEFTVTPKGDGSAVTWSLTGPSPFMCKVMQVFINFDEMCGKDFESGLASLKSKVETY